MNEETREWVIDYESAGRHHGIIWHDDGATSNIHKVDHSFLDRRSLAFHVAIAEKLRADPKLLEKVRDRLQKMLSDERVSISTRDAYLEWLEVIQQHSFEEALSILVDPSEEGNRLRQSTPFAGILSKAEREAITRKMSSIHH